MNDRRKLPRKENAQSSLIELLKATKEALELVRAPITRTDEKTFAIEVLHLLNTKLGGRCLQAEDAELFKFAEYACLCGCVGYDFEDGEETVVCSVCRVNRLHTSCTTTWTVTSPVCIKCGGSAQTEGALTHTTTIPYGSPWADVSAIRVNLLHKKPAAVRHALVYASHETAKHAGAQHVPEAGMRQLCCQVAAAISPRGVLTTQFEAAMKRVRNVTSMWALRLALRRVSALCDEVRGFSGVWQELSRDALNREVSANLTYNVWESTSEQRNIADAQQRHAEWHWDANGNQEYWFPFCIEHNINRAQPQTTRMLRIASGDATMFVYQGANTVGGSSRRRIVAANIAPNTHARALTMLQCTCTGAAPALLARDIGCAQECTRSMWSILDIPRGYAAPLDRRVFAGCVTVNSCANLSRQVAKRSDASMGAKVVHTPTEAVRFVNANLVKTGWTWHGGIYVGRSRLSEEEMEETFRCIVGANLVPEVPIYSGPPRYRRMTPDEAWRVVAGNGACTSSTAAAGTPTATLRPERDDSVRHSKVRTTASIEPIITPALSTATLDAIAMRTRGMRAGKFINFDVGFKYNDHRRSTEKFSNKDDIGKAVEDALRSDPVFGAMFRGLEVRWMVIIENGTLPQPPHKDDDIERSGPAPPRSGIPLVVMIPLETHFYLGVNGKERMTELRCDRPHAAVMGIDTRECGTERCALRTVTAPLCCPRAQSILGLYSGRGTT